MNIFKPRISREYMVDQFERAILEAIDEKMDDIANEIFRDSQLNLVRKHPKTFKSGKKDNSHQTSDTGALLKSGNINRRFLEKTIVYSAPYAADVEFGTTTSSVTVEKLLPWVKRKVLKNKGANDSQVRRVAQRIADSLKARGQAADPFLRPALEKAEVKLR